MEQSERLERLQWITLAAGLLAAAGLLLGNALAPSEPARLAQAYLVAFLYWNGLSLGCLGWLLLHYLVGGTWGFALERLLAAGARTLPLMALLFLPLLLVLPVLYPWAGAGSGGYLDEYFFAGRALFYFAVWSTVAILATGWSYQTDETADDSRWQRVVGLSAAGMVFYLFTTTFAAFDWLMSLEPDWFSSIFGWLALARDALGGLALVLLLFAVIGKRMPLTRLPEGRLYNTFGSLLLVALLGWAYLALMQYLVIWSANVPAEVVWYQRRTMEGWLTVAFVLLAFYLGLPAALLLLPPVKRRLELVAAIAGLILLLRLLHVQWLVLPAVGGAAIFHWTDVVMPLVMGGPWLALFFWQLKRHSLLAHNHPRLQEALAERQESYEPS